MNAEMINREKWRTSWKAEEAASFSGWDFSHLDGRWQEGEIPWDYGEIVREFLQDSMELLDMGTGGGEFLLTLGHPYARTTVTEGYPPNAALCRERLAPLGIRVNCIAPGVIDTEMMAAFSDEDRAALAEETPVGRLGTAAEIARTLVFLADEASGYITGQVIGQNGGLVI